MTDNNIDQRPYSYEEVMTEAEREYFVLSENGYGDGFGKLTPEGFFPHGKSRAAVRRYIALEALLCDLIEDGADEHTRQEQEACNDALVAYANTLPSDEGGGGCKGEHCVSSAEPGLPPVVSLPGCSDKLPILTSEGATPIAPGLAMRGYECNSPPPAGCFELPGVKSLPPLEIQHGGFDGGAKICYFGTWDTPAMVTMAAPLESAKQRAVNATRMADGKKQPEIINLAGRDVVVHPAGALISSTYYDWHLTFEGFDVFVHKDEVPKNDNPQIWVDFRAESVQRYGLYGADQVVLDFLQQLGFTKTRSRVSKVPIQVMTDIPMNVFVQLYLCGHRVGRGKVKFGLFGVHKTHGPEVETIQEGNEKNIHLKIYNKREEINTFYNDKTGVKYDQTIALIGAEWWRSNRPITRVEYTLGRDFLRSVGVESLEDFRLRERAVVEYLTHDRFRLLEKPKVRGTENDAEIHPIWERVKTLFFEHFTSAEVAKVKRKRRERISIDSERLERQGVGCLVNAVVVGFGKQASVAGVKNRIMELVNKVVAEKGDSFLEEFQCKVDLMEIAKGVEFCKDDSSIQAYSRREPTGGSSDCEHMDTIEQVRLTEIRERERAWFHSQGGGENGGVESKTLLPIEGCDDSPDSTGATVREQLDQHNARWD